MSERSNDVGAPVVGLPGGVAYLSEAQAAQLEVALASFADRWSLERHESCDGGLMLLVTPDGDDLVTFTVDAAADGLLLGALRDDVLLPCGRFDTMEDLMHALRELADRATNCR